MQRNVTGSAQQPKRASRRWAALIITVATALALAYGVVNPLFEAPDEHHHYFTAEYIATTWALPAVAADADGWLRQEAAQPPLYYVLGALLIAPLDLDPAAARAAVQFNPFVRLGDPTAGGNNINAFVHGPAEAWPWSGHVLAAHLLRALSALLGAGTLACVYAAGRLVWPDSAEPALLATALVGFLPQFNFVAGTISNDILIIFLATAGLLQLLRLWLGPPPGAAQLLLLGVTIGLAALTKTQGVLLLALALLVLALLAWRRRDGRLLLRGGLLVGGTVLLLAGWLWWRNWQLYGDPTAANQFVRLAGGDRHFTPAQALFEFRQSWTTFFGRFGWSNIPLPGWLVTLWLSIVAVAAAGAVPAVVRRRRAPGRPVDWLLPAWLAAWVGAVLAALVAFTMQTPGSQGRLLFPVLLPLALALAWGVHQWRRPALTALVGAAALLTALVSLLTVQLPAFRPPPTVTALPPTADALAIDLGHGVALVGSAVATESATPGDWVTVTLYWRAERPADADRPVTVRLLGRQFGEVGRFDGYPGRGQWPPTRWPAGAIVADTLRLPVVPDAVAPTELRVFVQLGDGTAYQAATTRLAPAAWPPTDGAATATLGDGIALHDVAVAGAAAAPPATVTAAPGSTLPVSATWRVTAPPGRHLTTLVHLTGPDGALAAQGDAPPLGGDFPTTLWRAGDVIADGYAVTLPADLAPGEYQLWLGLYDSATGERLPLAVAGARQADDRLLVATVVVQ